MLISGIQKFTMLDFPDKSAAIVFTPGCNFRCGYCHNPEFVLPELLEKIKDSFIPEEAFFNFLDERKNFLDGVVITGGEPTLMPELPDFVKKIKEKGFLVKLDTNGSNPGVVSDLIEKGLLDYIAMDIKTSLNKYQELVGPGGISDNIKKSVDLIMTSGVDYEFRSTILKETHPKEILQEMAELISGAKKFFLQTFRPERVLNPEFEKYQAFFEEEMEEIRQMFFKYADLVEIRR